MSYLATGALFTGSVIDAGSTTKPPAYDPAKAVALAAGAKSAFEAAQLQANIAAAGKLAAAGKTAPPGMVFTQPSFPSWLLAAGLGATVLLVVLLRRS